MASHPDLSVRPRPGRHARWPAALLVACALAVVAACGSTPANDATNPGTAAPSDNGAAGTRSEDDGFPVAIDHKFGSTTIEAEPIRIVTVGLTDQDALLALGVTPVGVTDWLAAHPNAIGPWAADDVDGTPPEIVGDAQAIGFERIAALEPDLILGLYSGLSQEDYDKLSQIAPTVAQPGDVVDYGISWQDQTRTVGRAIGASAEAEAVVEEVDARFAAAREANPDFEGAEGLVSTIYNDKLSIYASEDARGRFMASLGFVQPAEVTELANDTFSADVSRERVDLVDVDVLVWIVLDVETDRVKFAEDPLYSALDVHTGGHDVYVANGSDVGSALSFQSALSIPFLLDELVPQLAAAKAGTGADAATTTP